eukprot:jgi/Chlat1/4067/Chrsp26S04111
MVPVDAASCATPSEGRQGTAGDSIPKPRGFGIVVAATRSLGIGKDGTLPWNLPADMKHFKEVTTITAGKSKRNAVVMGRKTWESLPTKFRPLPGRLNVVLTRSKEISLPVEVLVFNSLNAALEELGSPAHREQIEGIYVIGGGQIFQEALASQLCEVVHLTQIDADIDCDTLLPPIDSTAFRCWSASSPIAQNGVRFSFLTLVRQFGKDSAPSTSRYATSTLSRTMQHRHDEYQYLDLIRDIIDTGSSRGSRTGTGTLAKFGCQMRFNLRHTFPLLTTKRVFWRGVAEELLWFISGNTNANALQRKGVHIWDGNASREYLDTLGLAHREAGDLGPVYGFQWRHFGAKYVDMHTDYRGQGVDQLARVIDLIKNNPQDRRIVLSAWNPADLDQMALPPCHMFCQFFVADGELSCQMYQRSCDMGLGVPFNIASYALLTRLLAHVCDLAPGDFIHVLGDAHVYTNHIEPLKTQLLNEPRPFPILNIKTTNKDIDGFSFDDFELIGYDPHQKIAMTMAV